MFAGDIEDMAKDNANFRQVLMTGKHAQVVAMSLPAGGDIGEETHPDTDQIFVIVDGDGEVYVDKETKPVESGDIIFVPAGALHNMRSLGQDGLKLLTIYAPPVHPDGTVHSTKAEALAEETGAGEPKQEW